MISCMKIEFLDFFAVCFAVQGAPPNMYEIAPLLNSSSPSLQPGSLHIPAGQAPEKKSLPPPHARHNKGKKVRVKRHTLGESGIRGCGHASPPISREEVVQVSKGSDRI